MANNLPWGTLIACTQPHCLWEEDDKLPTEGLRFGDADGGTRVQDNGNCWVHDSNDFEYAVPLNTITPLTPVPQPLSTHASLERVFALAVAQSRDGKGADRHGNGKPFENQPIVRDIAELGSNHGAIAQVRKKALESTRLAATGRKDMALAELLGAMVYAGAAYLILEADNG